MLIICCHVLNDWDFGNNKALYIITFHPRIILTNFVNALRCMHPINYHYSKIQRYQLRPAASFISLTTSFQSTILHTYFDLKIQNWELVRQNKTLIVAFIAIKVIGRGVPFRNSADSQREIWRFYSLGNWIAKKF